MEDQNISNNSPSKKRKSEAKEYDQFDNESN